jgi:hypothetical protein
VERCSHRHECTMNLSTLFRPPKRDTSARGQYWVGDAVCRRLHTPHLQSLPVLPDAFSVCPRLLHAHSRRRGLCGSARPAETAGAHISLSERPLSAAHLYRALSRVCASEARRTLRVGEQIRALGRALGVRGARGDPTRCRQTGQHGNAWRFVAAITLPSSTKMSTDFACYVARRTRVRSLPRYMRIADVILGRVIRLAQRAGHSTRPSTSWVAGCAVRPPGSPPGESLAPPPPA